MSNFDGKLDKVLKEFRLEMVKSPGSLKSDIPVYSNPSPLKLPALLRKGTLRAIFHDGTTYMWNSHALDHYQMVKALYLDGEWIGYYIHLDEEDGFYADGYYLSDANNNRSAVNEWDLPEAILQYSGMEI